MENGSPGPMTSSVELSPRIVSAETVDVAQFSVLSDIRKIAQRDKNGTWGSEPLDPNTVGCSGMPSLS